ncbi:hypothetical protein Tco_0977395 [Tanacetum coccineum]|uniref:Uncharacterized protein n=1 Tax=Tanacetum coccineum TaxID=301880 RepID=A0ABQ5EJZ7_9ASTR
MLVAYNQRFRNWLAVRKTLQEAIEMATDLNGNKRQNIGRGLCAGNGDKEPLNGRGPKLYVPRAPSHFRRCPQVKNRPRKWQAVARAYCSWELQGKTQDNNVVWGDWGTSQREAMKMYDRQKIFWKYSHEDVPGLYIPESGFHIDLSYLVCTCGTDTLSIGSPIRYERIGGQYKSFPTKALYRLVVSMGSFSSIRQKKVDRYGCYHLFEGFERIHLEMPSKLDIRHYEFQVMRFGLTNAPAVLWDLMMTRFLEFYLNSTSKSMSASEDNIGSVERKEEEGCVDAKGKVNSYASRQFKDPYEELYYSDLELGCSVVRSKDLEALSVWYQVYGKAMSVLCALTGKNGTPRLRVRALVMTISLDLPKQNLDAHNESTENQRTSRMRMLESYKVRNLFTMKETDPLEELARMLPKGSSNKAWNTVSIICNRDPSCIKFWRSLQKVWVQFRLSTAYIRQQTCTGTKRCRNIQTLIRFALELVLIDFGNGWVKHLPLVSFYTITVYHASIKVSPFFEDTYSRKMSFACLLGGGLEEVQLTGPEIVQDDD